MDKWEASEIIEKRLCKEVMTIAETIQKNDNISIQDVEKLDKIYHTLKSKETYEAMVAARDYEEEMDGMSGRRGRAANGRYVSRTGAPHSDEWERGYSEAMSRMHGPYYNEPRRW